MTQVRKAVVLAAGMGSRLGADRAKPLLPVAGVPILQRSLVNLAAAGVRETVLVVGHRASEIRAAIGSTVAGMAITYVQSDLYSTTNNAYSLWLAADHLDEDLWLVEGDVVFEAELLDRLDIATAEVVCALSPYRTEMNGTVARLNRHGRITGIYLPGQQGPELDLGTTFKTVNIHLLRRRYLREEFLPSLRALIDEGGHGAYYELIIADSVDRGRFGVHGVDCGQLRWYEVDDVTDLAAANFLFGASEDQLGMLQSLHGGYWRYDIVDHCLLYNMYFPPGRMVREMRREFLDALVHYPVGHQAVQELLGSAIRQPAQRLVVGNGASELIKILGRGLGRTGLVVPGFNEYEAVFADADQHRIRLPPPDFEFDVDAFLAEVAETRLDAVIVTSPNNPTSMAVPRADLVRACAGLRERGIRLVVDESFVDFAEPGQSLESDLEAHPNLVIVKSMSKVYGVGGLRLGYLLSADLDLVAAVRAELPIWNVNGFAESFLRLLPRFRAAFLASCDRVRADRAQLVRKLEDIDGLTVYRPDANYVMVRLPDGVSGPAVVRAMFAEQQILIKDCAGKSMPDGERYLRLSCRTPQENDAMVTALAGVLAAPRRVPLRLVA